MKNKEMKEINISQPKIFCCNDFSISFKKINIYYGCETCFEIRKKWC